MVWWRGPFPSNGENVRRPSCRARLLKPLILNSLDSGLQTRRARLTLAGMHRLGRTFRSGRLPLPEPYFKHQESPQMIAVISPPALMLVDQVAYEGRGCYAATGELGAQHMIVQKIAQGATKPVGKRDSESHFLALAKSQRETIADCVEQ